MMDDRVQTFPFWSVRLKSGTVWPTCGPSLETSILGRDVAAVC